MFGNVGGAASEDLAMEAFEDDLKLTGRGVCGPKLECSGTADALPGTERTRYAQREPIYPILPTLPSPSPRSARQHRLILSFDTTSPAESGFTITSLEISHGWGIESGRTHWRLPMQEDCGAGAE